MNNKSKVIRLNEKEQKVVEFLRGANVAEFVSEIRGLYKNADPTSNLNVKKLLSVLEDKKSIPSLDDLIQKAFLTKEQAQTLIQAILENKNIIIYGLTGTGKSTLLHAILTYMLENEMIDKVLFHDMYNEYPLDLNDFNVPFIKESGTSLTLNQLSFIFNSTLRNRLVVSEMNTSEVLIGIELALQKGARLLTTIHAGNLKSLKDRMKVWQSDIFSNHEFVCVNIELNVSNNHRHLNSIDTVVS